MADTDIWTYVIVFLVAPWVILGLMAIFLGFNFWLTMIMLTLFSLGIVLSPAFLGRGS